MYFFSKEQDVKLIHFISSDVLEYEGTSAKLISPELLKLFMLFKVVQPERNINSAEKKTNIPKLKVFIKKFDIIKFKNYKHFNKTKKKKTNTVTFLISNDFKRM